MGTDTTEDNGNMQECKTWYNLKKCTIEDKKNANTVNVWQTFGIKCSGGPSSGYKGPTA